MSFELNTTIDLARARNITLGGRELKVAPLTLRSIIAVTDLQPRLLKEAGASEHIDTLIEFVMLGLKRTYPDLTKDELLESEATIDELRQAMVVVMEQAGGKKRDDAEGEQKATALSVVGAGTSPGSALN
jgi:hypothetical protein